MLRYYALTTSYFVIYTLTTVLLGIYNLDSKGLYCNPHDCTTNSLVVSSLVCLVWSAGACIIVLPMRDKVATQCYTTFTMVWPILFWCGGFTTYWPVNQIGVCCFTLTHFLRIYWYVEQRASTNIHLASFESLQIDTSYHNLDTNTP